MQYFVIIVAIVCIGFFIWASVENKKRKKKQDKRKDRPLFRTEEDLEEYGKPMESHPVDFDDEE
ncbi:MAG: hypothetical protein WBC74_01720 [Candidatus Omnitrophota bacterium]